MTVGYEPVAVDVESKSLPIHVVPSIDASIVSAAVVHAAGVTNPVNVRSLQSIVLDVLAPDAIVTVEFMSLFISQSF